MLFETESEAGSIGSTDQYNPIIMQGLSPDHQNRYFQANKLKKALRQGVMSQSLFFHPGFQ
jgi:hypothetical protein